MATRSTRPISWIKAALREFEKFPDEVRTTCLTALTIAAEGGKADIAKPMQGLGLGRVRDRPAVSWRRIPRSPMQCNILAVEIIKALDRDGLSVRSAQGRTGIAAADFSRVRNADPGRFTVDRLMSIINRLGSRVEVKIKVRRAERIAHVSTSRLASRA